MVAGYEVAFDTSKADVTSVGPVETGGSEPTDRLPKVASPHRRNTSAEKDPSVLDLRAEEKGCAGGTVGYKLDKHCHVLDPDGKTYAAKIISICDGHALKIKVMSPPLDTEINIQVAGLKEHVFANDADRVKARDFTFSVISSAENILLRLVRGTSSAYVEFDGKSLTFALMQYGYALDEGSVR